MERLPGKPLLPFLGIGLLSGVAGFFLGCHFGSRKVDAVLNRVEPGISSKEDIRRHAASGPVEHLERILADRTSVSSRKRKMSGYLDRRLLEGEGSVLLKELKALPGSPDRTAALLRLAATPPAGMPMSEWSDGLLDGLDGVVKSSVASALARTWAEADPRDAFDHALKEADAGYRGALVDESMARLAREDAPAAASMLLESRSHLGGGFAAALSTLCEGWTESDPQTAKRWVADHSANWMPYERDEANSMIITTMALEHPMEAVRELSMIADSERRELALREIFTQWAESDPASAAAAMPEYRPGHDVDLATEVALTWSDYDYPSTMQWVKSTPAIPDELRDSVLKRVEDAHGGLTKDAGTPE